ncbi:hypothetical protein SAY86_029698 [Trapa natans]|uniref:Uncharacterized protein n=1 Tax=Trapa natans TaxID=22666 RepID=A0AAN7RC59_TRANT|nr:hypothetical protein SAY86_029698 [Trapa natans]
MVDPYIACSNCIRNLAVEEGARTSFFCLSGSRRLQLVWLTSTVRRPSDKIWLLLQEESHLNIPSKGYSESPSFQATVTGIFISSSPRIWWNRLGKSEPLS